MIGPKRLIEEGTSFDQALLRAGREDRPSTDYERRVLAAASALSATASAATGRPTLLGRLVRPQYLAMIVAVGVGAAIVSTTTAQRSDQAAAVAPSSVTTTEQGPKVERTQSVPTSIETSIKAAQAVAVMTPDALPSAPAPSSAPVAPRASAPTPAAPATAETAARAAAPAVVSGASLQREVELLDSVKRSLRSGAHADAQHTLDGYDAEFPSGTLKPEAGFLRIRLLLAKGERARAAALGDELRAKYPNSVHAKRIQAALAADAANDSQGQASPR